MHTIIINEFSDRGCPVTKMAFDFGDYLQGQGRSVQQVYIGRRYRPGGLAVRRILNLIMLHLLLPPILFGAKLRSIMHRESVVVVATTLPPLVHWSAVLWGKFLALPVVCWYQDAHPELEARLLERRNQMVVPKLLRALDAFFLRLAAGVVTLDESMLLFLKNRLEPKADMRFLVAAPWVTYKDEAYPLKTVPQTRPLKFLYAGHYGFAHDLSDLVKVLGAMGIASRKNVRISFVGMNAASQALIRNQFSGLEMLLDFISRKESFDELCMLMREYDFGIVSLNEKLYGIACPSKAFTYLSQGLPILYVGPPHTLSSQLCASGWGIALRDIDFEKFVLGKQDVFLNSGQILAHPGPSSRRAMDEFLQTFA